MLNEPQVQQPPTEQRPDAPSLAELLAARPRTNGDAGVSLAGSQPLMPGEDSLAQLPPERDFLASLPPHADAFAVAQGHAATAVPCIEAISLADPSVKTPLLLVHAGQAEGALAQGWMRNVLSGKQLHHAHFQDPVAELVQHQQPHAVLIQFDPRCVDAAVALVAHLKMQHPQLPRLAIGRTRDASCMLAALRAGVQDFLDIDSSIEVAQQAIRALADRPPSAAPDAPSAPKTAILSARAGLGSSLIAAHLSWYLQTQLARATPFGASVSESPATGVSGEADALAGLLIELGTPGGDCAIYLNTPGEFSFADAVTQQLRLDRRMAQSALARHESGLRLLTQVGQPRLTSSRDVGALLKRLSQHFRHIVLDLGAVSSPQLAEGVLPHASEIWMVCDQSVASVVWTTELLQQMEPLQIARDRLKLIVNRHDPRLELSAQQIERQLNLPLLAVIPERRKELSEVVNQGRLLPPASRREPYVRAIEQLATQLLSAHHPEIAAAVPASSKSLASPILRLLQGIRKN